MVEKDSPYLETYGRQPPVSSQSSVPQRPFCAQGTCDDL